MASYEIYGETWEQHDGKCVIIDGLKHQLRIDTYQAIYPYPNQQIRVYAEPVNKQSKYYRKVREELGDDWSTDILDSDIDVQVEVLRQLNEDRPDQRLWDSRDVHRSWEAAWTAYVDAVDADDAGDAGQDN